MKEKLKKPTYSKSREAPQSILLIGVVCLLVLFSINFASAWEFDNVKEYNYETKTVTIVNAFGLGADLAKATLKTPLQYSVGAGYQKVVEIEIESFDDYENLFGELKLYNIQNNMNEISRQIDFKYKTYENVVVDDYERVCVLDQESKNGTEICTYEVSGNHLEQKEVWNDFNKASLFNKGTQTVGLFTNVLIGDSVEWIPTIAGEEVSEWANWTHALHTELLVYYSLDESSGTNFKNNVTPWDNNGTAVFSNIAGGTGKIANSGDFNGTIRARISMPNFERPTTDFTIAAWIKTSGGGKVQQMILGADDVSSGNQQRSYLLMVDDAQEDEFSFCLVDNCVDTGGNLIVGTWYHVAAVFNGTGADLYVNGVFNVTKDFGTTANAGTGMALGSFSDEEGFETHMFLGDIDEVGIWNRTLTALEIGSLYNAGNGFAYPLGGDTGNVTLNTPTTGFTSANATQLFNATAQIIGGPTVVNMTLWTNESGAWEVKNTTTGLTTAYENQTWTRVVAPGYYVWNSRACDSDGDCGFALANFTFTIESIILEDYWFNISALETSSQNFTANISANSSLTGVSLNYSKTYYEMAQTGNNWSVVIDVLTTKVKNNTVRFNYTFAGAGSSSSDLFQNVNATWFNLCNATIADKYINFTFADENNESKLLGEFPTSNFTYWLGSGAVRKELTYTNTVPNPDLTFCYDGDNQTVNVDYRVQYEANGYPQRVFNPDTTTLNNTTTNKTLYLLQTSDGIYVTFQVINAAEQVLSDVFINATRLIGSTQQLVGEGTTDASGSLTMFLNPNFVHTFNFVKSGFTSLVNSFAPTQTSFTITLGSSGVTSENDYTKGITYTIHPKDTTLVNDTIYTFNFTLTSSFWDVTSFGFNLENATNSVIGTNVVTANGGTATLDLNTTTNNTIIMQYFWIIGGNVTNATVQWGVLSSEGTGFSINNFFTDLNTYLGVGMFGIDNFGLAMISFLIIFMFTGIISWKYGFTSPAAVSGLVFALMLFLDVGTDMLDNLNPSPVPHFPTIIIGLIFFGSLYLESTR